MSRKIIFSQDYKQEIIEYVKNTYQCTLTDICTHFCISRNSVRNNFDSNFLEQELFHGVKDTTKEKLRKANLGKKQSEEVVEKRVKKTLETKASWSSEKISEVYKKVQNTKKEKYGTLENYYSHQVKKSKETKLLRYGDENYNNMNKTKETKLARYNDENYNNKEKIKETQYKLYNGFAFEDKEKYEATMLSKYGVKHNWESSDPMLNGRYTMFSRAGSKENHYKNILYKGKKTKLLLYGDEFYSNSEKAQETMLKKYGVRYYCVTEDCQLKSRTPESLNKKNVTKKLNGTYNVSAPEIQCLKFLTNKFGEEDIVYEYQDDRYSLNGYKFKCDFYIKSLDVFIELNLHPAHYLHPYNEFSEEDKKVLEKLQSNQTQWNKTVINVWTVRDVNKQQVAKDNNLNYFAFYPKDDYYDILQRL